MPIYHSKTWPASTVAVVRVDQQGRAVSSLAPDEKPEPLKNSTCSQQIHKCGQVKQEEDTPMFYNEKMYIQRGDEIGNGMKREERIDQPTRYNKENVPNGNDAKTSSTYSFPPTPRTGYTYDCMPSDREADFMRCNCQFSASNKNGSYGNGAACHYNEDNLKFINDAKQFLRNRIKKDRGEKRKKSLSDSNMTVSTILRSNSCDSSILYNFSKLKTLQKQSSSSDFQAASNILNSKICYCIQLLALSPNTLLKTVQLPTSIMERRYSSTSISSMCRWNPRHSSEYETRVNVFSKKGRSKSVSHVTNDKLISKSKSNFRRCNSTIEAAKRRPSDMVDKDLINNANLSKTPLSARKTQTLYRHYYPEGGWGWTILVVCVVVSVLDHGMQLAAAILVSPAAEKFKIPAVHAAGWLGALSTAVALFISPVTVACCLRKSTRVTAVMGGLVAALGCLFTSFASQFHQLFFSYGAVIGVGVGLARDCATLMVAQYFKRRRELVEVFVVSGSGLGIAIMSAFIKGAISAKGWRLGLQAVTGVVFLTFILGTFYRSASLYHPQRRAILHLKNQNKIKKKIKDKTKVDESPPFFDFQTLKSKTVRILLLSTSISAFGINTPIFYLAHQAEEEGFGEAVVLFQVYMGLAWTTGCAAFGLYIIKSSPSARFGRQYLCQAAIFICGLTILIFTLVQSSYYVYVTFAWVYGIFCGGYHYTLKMYTYERVRSRNFARTWGFVQCSQAIPIVMGVPIAGYINVGFGGKAGYYFSSTCIIIGSLVLFFIDLHRRNISRHKHSRSNGSQGLCDSRKCPQRHPSFSRELDREPVLSANAAAAAIVLGADLGMNTGQEAHSAPEMKAELTCISEEGLADMDLPDNLLDDLDYIGDCITSCNKVENYLMLSEYENNLIAEMPMILDRKGRKWSIARGGARTVGIGGVTLAADQPSETNDMLPPTPSSNNYGKLPKWKLTPQHAVNSRLITVIDEASV